jgi:hypothetical protein
MQHTWHWLVTAKMLQALLLPNENLCDLQAIQTHLSTSPLKLIDSQLTYAANSSMKYPRWQRPSLAAFSQLTMLIG